MRKEEQRDENLAYCRLLLKTQEAEILKLGAVLHDSIAQELYAIRVSLQRFILNNGRTDEIEAIKKMLNATITDVQHLANHLFPTILRDFGLAKALDDLISQRKYKKEKIIIHIDRYVDKLSTVCHLHLYRIIKEYLYDVSLHTEISSVVIKMKIMKNNLIMEILDNRSHNHIININDTQDQYKNIKSSILYFNGLMETQIQATGIKLVITLKIDIHND